MEKRILSWCTCRRGFTLIELLMVLLIIGMLTSVLIVNFQSQNAQMKVAQTKANLATLRTTIDIFQREEDKWPKNDLSDLVDESAPSGNVYLGLIPYETVTYSNDVVNTLNGNGGWFWDAVNHTLTLNLTGTDVNGDNYQTY